MKVLQRGVTFMLLCASKHLLEIVFYNPTLWGWVCGCVGRGGELSTLKQWNFATVYFTFNLCSYLINELGN